MLFTAISKFQKSQYGYMGLAIIGGTAGRLRCIAEYVRNNSIPTTEVKLLDTVRGPLAAVSTVQLDWADGWIRTMKRGHNLSPSMIRHRQGALARCFDWMLRKHPEVMGQNPLRLLKRGFATYTAEDERHLVAAGKAATAGRRSPMPISARRMLCVRGTRPELAWAVHRCRGVPRRRGAVTTAERLSNRASASSA